MAIILILHIGRKNPTAFLKHEQLDAPPPKVMYTFEFQMIFQFSSFISVFIGAKVKFLNKSDVTDCLLVVKKKTVISALSHCPKVSAKTLLF